MKTKIWPGCRVLNTRPAAQAEGLNHWIEAAGGIAVPCPMLAIEPLPSEQWVPFLPPLQQINQAIFTSANAAKYFITGLQKSAPNAIELLPPTLNLIAIGQATATALAQYGLTIDTIPPTSNSEHLLNLPCLQSVHHQSILLVKGKGGRTLIAETLQKRKANLILVDVYQRKKPLIDDNQLQRLWRENQIDMIVFTSKEAMQNLMALLGEEALPWLRGKPCLVISQRLAAYAKEIGIQHITLFDNIGELQG